MSFIKKSITTYGDQSKMYVSGHRLIDFKNEEEAILQFRHLILLNKKIKKSDKMNENFVLLKTFKGKFLYRNQYAIKVSTLKEIINCLFA